MVSVLMVLPIEKLREKEGSKNWSNKKRLEDRSRSISREANQNYCPVPNRRFNPTIISH